MSRRELDLDRALADLAASLEFPPTPDLAAAVSAPGWTRPRPATPARPRRWSWPAGWRRLAVAGLAVVLLAVAVLVASPGTREAVARRLGLRGIGVELGGPPPPTVTTAPGGRLDLGPRGAGHPRGGPAPGRLPGPDPTDRRARAAGRRVRLRGRAPRRPGRPRLARPAGPARLGLHRRRAADHPVPGRDDARVHQEGRRGRPGRVPRGRRRARLLVQRRAPLLHLPGRAPATSARSRPAWPATP